MGADLEAFRERLRPAQHAAPDADTRIIPTEEEPRTTLSATAERALRHEEAARARGFARALLFLCLGALAFIPFQPGVAWLRNAMATVFVAMIAISAWVFWRARKPSRYGVGLFRFYGVCCVLGCTVLLYYCGVFSAAPVVITLGVAFFGQGDDRRWGITVCCTIIAIYFAIAFAITVGALPELGLFREMHIAGASRLFAVVMVPAVLGVTLWQARLSRKTTREAVERLDEALMLVQQREALLREARQDLDQALGVGAGARGAWSGRRLDAYAIAELIGRGASGEIYSARHADSGEVVAIKILASVGLGDAELLTRFRREAHIAQRLRSPYVVRVIDVGSTVPYIVMELLVGHDLAWHLRRRQQLPLDEVVILCDQVAAGLEVAHAAGIVHRDLKPQNLFLADQTWKILDFGVAKLQASDGTLTRGGLIGTPGYMSPEQAQGAEAEDRSDLFSLGAVTYRALTGQPPFQGADLPESLFQIVYGMPAQPSALVAHLPPDVDAVLAIALAKRIENRFSRATELAQALHAAAGGRLDPALRARAAELIAALPWGTTVRPER